MGGTRRGAAPGKRVVVSAQLWRWLPGAIPDSYHLISGRENPRRRQRCEWCEPARDGQPLAAARGGSSPVTSRSHDLPTSYRNAGARSAASSPTWDARSERWFPDHVSEPLRPSIADHAPSTRPNVTGIQGHARPAWGRQSAGFIHALWNGRRPAADGPRRPGSRPQDGAPSDAHGTSGGAGTLGHRPVIRSRGPCAASSSHVGLAPPPSLRPQDRPSAAETLRRKLVPRGTGTGAVAGRFGHPQPRPCAARSSHVGLAPPPSLRPQDHPRLSGRVRCTPRTSLTSLTRRFSPPEIYKIRNGNRVRGSGLWAVA
jgi:hypothetical protein